MKIENKLLTYYLETKANGTSEQVARAVQRELSALYVKDAENYLCMMEYIKDQIIDANGNVHSEVSKNVINAIMDFDRSQHEAANQILIES